MICMIMVMIMIMIIIIIIMIMIIMLMWMTLSSTSTSADRFQPLVDLGHVPFRHRQCSRTPSLFLQIVLEEVSDLGAPPNRWRQIRGRFNVYSVKRFNPEKTTLRNAQFLHLRFAIVHDDMSAET